MIVGITGTDGAGKGRVVDYLVEKKGFIHCSARALWIDEINAQGLEVKREHMRLVANELRAKHGNDFLITEYSRRTGFEPGKDYIIDSIRAIAEVEALKKFGGALWAVDADRHVRFKRIQARASEGAVSFEEFVAQEELEMNDPHPNGMQKSKVMDMADVTFLNDKTPEDLFAQVELSLQKGA